MTGNEKDIKEIQEKIKELKKNEPQSGAMERGLYFGKLFALEWTIGKREFLEVA